MNSTDITAWPALTVAGLVLLLTTVAYRRYLSPLSTIPGPFWASFSRLWHVYITIEGRQNEELVEAHEKYGHFVRLANNEVSVSHPDAVKKVLLATLEKGTMYKMSTFPDWRYENPMSITDPKRKVELSKHFASGYTLTNALKAEESIDRLVLRFLDRMNEFATSGSAMKLDRYITYLTFDLLGEVLFSKPFGYTEAGADINGSIATNEKLIGVHAVVSHFRWIQLAALNPVTAKLMPWGHLFNTAYDALQERRANPDARFDVIAHWLRTAAAHPDRLTDRDLLGNTTANVGAGSDTLSCALQSFIYHMARKPEAWSRARSEILKAQEAEGACRSSVVTYADASKLPFFQACIKEALRIHNPVPMGLPRIAPPGGLTIGDTTLPAGTTVSVNPWVIHHSKELWGPDAHEFNPDRWLGPDAAQLDKYWCPFGAGYMSCPGQHFAKIELSKILSTVVRDYDISLVDPKKSWNWKAYFITVPYDWPVYVSKASTS
ncbi:cytochrome P450 [Pestalotiopsis sp. NC0098]|nr:cytochrome P450 [Pestalotiopsis sp. NC0098]